MRKVIVFFGELDDRDVDWIIAQGRQEPMEEGACLVEEGKPLGAFYIVLTGAFIVTVAARGGEEIVRLGAGEVVGEISFVDSRMPSGTVKALSRSVVFAIPRAVLARKLKDDAGFASRFYRALAVMLAYRLRRFMMKGATAHPDVEPPDQLDAGVLDNVHLAGARFERMLKRVLPA